MTSPSANEEWIATIQTAIVDDIKKSGYFRSVNEHEIRRTNNELTAAVWCQQVTSVGAVSGLSVTSARVMFVARLYGPATAQPRDWIDITLLKAASNLVRRWHDDFDFGGVIRNVDLFGNYGVGLEFTAGYLPLSEAQYQRTIDITVPCIVNDVWTQA